MIRILNHCHRHRGFVYQPGRFAADKLSIEVGVRSRRARQRSARGATSRRRVTIIYNLQTVRAYLLKEDFQQFWEYNSPTWAGNFLDFWCYQTMRSRIEPMKKIARALRAHRPLLLNYFKAKKQFSSGVIEGAQQ